MKLIPFFTRLKTIIYIDPAKVVAIVQIRGEAGTVGAGDQWAAVYLRGGYESPIHLDHPIEEVVEFVNRDRT